jgi:hypothetical protein
MRIYRIDKSTLFPNVYTHIVFMDNERALQSMLSINKRLNEPNSYGDVFIKGCENLYWTIETDSEIISRFEGEFYPNVKIISN